MAESRTEAKGIIESGCVYVLGKCINKPAYDVPQDSATVEVRDYNKKYVSRGGFKLESAHRDFKFEISGKAALDVGASSGGFTDFLLQNGAKSVIALDSGTAQLAKKLLCDKRVISIENYNARNLSANDLPYLPNLAVMDVSFISATYIIPSLFNALDFESDFICLVKPQFEVGRQNLGKGGIVKSEKAREDALKKVIACAESVGFITKATKISDVKGGDGNIEYLAHFYKPKKQ